MFAKESSIGHCWLEDEVLSQAYESCAVVQPFRDWPRAFRNVSRLLLSVAILRNISREEPRASGRTKRRLTSSERLPLDAINRGETYVLLTNQQEDVCQAAVMPWTSSIVRNHNFICNTRCVPKVSGITDLNVCKAQPPLLYQKTSSSPSSAP